MKNSKASNIVLFLSLVLVLVVCSFLVLFYEISSYQKIDSQNESVDNAHYPGMYLSNKMRGASGLRVEDNKLIIENEKTETFIYLYNGNLLELTTLKNYDIDESAGEKLFAMDDFNIIENNNLININYTVEGKQSNVVFKVRGDLYE